MFSGGLDSFAMGWKLLNDPKYEDYNIHFHHLHIQNREQRDAVELDACKAFMERCSAEGYKFRYTEGVVDFKFLSGGPFPMDTFLYLYIAAEIANSNTGISKIAIGMVTEYFGNNLTSMNYTNKCKGILQAAVSEYRAPVEIILPILGYNKLSEYKSLPPYLSDKFWSCRRPIQKAQCGQCLTCKELKEWGVEHPVYKND